MKKHAKKSITPSFSDCIADFTPILDDELEMSPSKIHTRIDSPLRTEKYSPSVRRNIAKDGKPVAPEFTPILDDTLLYSYDYD